MLPERLAQPRSDAAESHAYRDEAWRPWLIMLSISSRVRENDRVYSRLGKAFYEDDHLP